MPKIVSAAEAARTIPDGAAVAVNSSSGLNCPDAVLKAIGERFDREAHPRNLTMLHPIAAGDMFGIRGIEHIAKPGLIGRIIAGSYPSGPSTSEPPMIWQMLGANEMPAYNVPSGIMFDLMREAAAKRPGVITKVAWPCRPSSMKMRGTLADTPKPRFTAQPLRISRATRRAMALPVPNSMRPKLDTGLNTSPEIAGS